MQDVLDPLVPSDPPPEVDPGAPVAGGQGVSHARSAALVVVAVLALIVTLSVVDHGTRPVASEADRRAVAAATTGPLDYTTLAAAWSRTTAGDTSEGVAAVGRQVPRRLLAAHAEGGAIILTFAGRHGGCVDLVSRPEATVTTRRRCGS